MPADSLEPESPERVQARPTVLGALTDPLCSWSPRARWPAICVSVLLGISAVLFFVPLNVVFHSPDSSHYLKIASGHSDIVMQPFASRQLGARVAALLSRLFAGNIHAGFLLQAALSLIFAMAATCWLAARGAAPRWLLPALMLVPSWSILARYLVLPDLWYAALLAGLLVLLAQERYLWAALMMLPLMLSRESTSLTLVCFLAAGWTRWSRRQRWLYAATAIACAAIGTFVVQRLAAGSQPNREHLPQALYLFAKVPWNFLRNVVGIVPWSDANPELCKVPVWSVDVHLGPVHALGTCGFSFIQQLIALEGTLTNFGLLPLLVAVLWWRHRRWQNRTVLLRFALLYGGVSYLLAPVLGAGFVHLMQYAWPLFLVALPQIFSEFQAELNLATVSSSRRIAQLAFFALHLAVPVVLLWPWFLSRQLLGIAVWIAAYALLRRWLGPPSRSTQIGTASSAAA